MDRLIEWCDGDEIDRLAQFLVDRIRDFNVEATGFRDARGLGACVRNEVDDIVAALDGYTWGACCVVEHLWVLASQRGHGLGRALLAAAEAEASARGCEQVVVSTHSFQSPAFYERLGYARTAVVVGDPKGHANIIFAKPLVADMQARDADAAERPF